MYSGSMVGLMSLCLINCRLSTANTMGTVSFRTDSQNLKQAKCDSLQLFLCFYLVQYLAWQWQLCLRFSFQIWEGDTNHLVDRNAYITRTFADYDCNKLRILSDFYLFLFCLKYWRFHPSRVILRNFVLFLLNPQGARLLALTSLN